MIIPCYNAARFIGESLDSIVAATGGEAEILVVDDGSTDDSAAVVRDYAAANRALRMHLRFHAGRQNRGAAATRNYGASLASEPYLAFLDADDLYLPHRFDESLRWLQENPETGAVFGRFKYEIYGGSSTETLRGISKEQADHQDDEVLPDPAEEDLFVQLLRGVSGIHTSTVTIRRDVFGQTGGFPELKYCEDHALWVKIFAKFSVHRVEGPPVSLYRIYSDSLCGAGIMRPDFMFGPVLALRDALTWLTAHHASPVIVQRVKKAISGRIFYQYDKVRSISAQHRRYMCRLMCSTAFAIPGLLADRRFYSVLLRLLVR